MPTAKKQMPYRILCNDARREDVKASLDLALGLFCYVLLLKIQYGIQLFAARSPFCSRASALFSSYLCHNLLIHTTFNYETVFT